jgi:MFS family permease
MVAVLAIGYLNVATFWISESMVILGCLLTGIRYAASNNLALEQIPMFRGTMMALNTVAINLGGTIGSVIGGTILLLYNWNNLGLVLGSFSLVACFIFFRLVMYTRKTKDTSQTEHRGGER